ncbi:hypothetical protein MTO96_022701 [Rhipicephalus appendiculatus]
MLGLVCVFLALHTPTPPPPRHPKTPHTLKHFVGIAGHGGARGGCEGGRRRCYTSWEPPASFLGVCIPVVPPPLFPGAPLSTGGAGGGGGLSYRCVQEGKATLGERSSGADMCAFPSFGGPPLTES